MKYQVVGPRVLLKIKKATDTFEGSQIVRPETLMDRDTMAQTLGIVEQIGSEVNTIYQGFEQLKKGQTVHFQRYGAQILNSKNKNEEFEYWVINGKDILCIEEGDVYEGQEITKNLETFKP